MAPKLEMTRLQMKVAEVWLHAARQQFVDVSADPIVQLEQIQKELARRDNAINRLARRVLHLELKHVRESDAI